MEQSRNSPDIELKELVKIYPFVKVGIFDRKRQREALEKQRAMPYLTNEGVIAVQHINLSIPAGSFVSILGPSGCGKTTLLRMLSGLEKPSAGEVWFGDRLMNGLPPEEWNAAMVFQSYNLYPHLTVFDNIAFPLRSLHMPREELEETVTGAAELLQIDHLLDRLPGDLSGGEQQRTAIGRAIVRKPDLFLLDEPFSNLDAPMRSALGAAIKRLHASLGATFLYVTHDEREAVSLGERILVMEEGKLVRDVPAGEYFSQQAE
ncbi:MAG: ATP-binding cassette domain-containing protein [Oscillospiraceae bacterium]|nr:ATP-binding cassette domain-containing protein [Oscillospiraceae bacterium]